VVASVAPGDAFAQVDERSPTRSAAEAGGAGYQDLIDALVARGLAIPIASCPCLAGDAGTLRFSVPASTFFHRNQEHGFYSLLSTSSRALSQGRGLADTGAFTWWSPANGSQRVRVRGLALPGQGDRARPVRRGAARVPGI
jgi:hypothetical protein